MDPVERYTRRSLRDVLVSQGTVTSEQADELIESAYEANEPFGAVLVQAGYLTSWDLAKTVSTHYQMPVLPLENFDFDTGIFEAIPAATLYQHQVVPVGRFGRSWSFVTIEPPSRECMDALKEACGSSAVFFFVSEVHMVQRALQAHVKVVDVTSDTSWQSIFDSGEERVLEEMHGDEPSAGGETETAEEKAAEGKTAEA